MELANYKGGYAYRMYKLSLLDMINDSKEKISQSYIFVLILVLYYVRSEKEKVMYEQNYRYTDEKGHLYLKSNIG